MIACMFGLQLGVCFVGGQLLEVGTPGQTGTALHQLERTSPTQSGKAGRAANSCGSFVQLIPRAEAISKACCNRPGACERITSSLSLPAAGEACVDTQCADLFIAFWDDCQTVSRAVGVDAAGLDKFYASCRDFDGEPASTVDATSALHERQAKPIPSSRYRSTVAGDMSALSNEPIPSPLRDATYCRPEQRATCDRRSADEPDVSDTAYFAAIDFQTRQEPPFEPPRLSNVTTEQFAKFSQAGWPIIVTDVSRGWPMLNWTCESIGKRFPSRRMRAEYTAETGAPFPDINDQLLGEVEKWTSMNLSSGVYDSLFAESAPQYAPFYWGVKDSAEHGEAELLTQIGSLTRVPYCMEPAAQREMEITPEFWFSVPGAGAKAHMDPHCESSLSVQLSGTKLWRLSPIPDIAGSNFVDGFLYTQSFVDRYFRGVAWKPMFEFKLKPGEGLFFPPGFIHETKNIGNDCAASITYQYEVPFAARYFRKFMSRVHRTVSLEECHATLGDIATLFRLSSPAARTLTASSDADATCLAAHELGSAVDADDNGMISLSEIRGTLAKGWQHGKTLIRDTDALAFHDLDDDGALTKAELVQSINAYGIDSVKAGAQPRGAPAAKKQALDSTEL